MSEKNLSVVAVSMLTKNAQEPKRMVRLSFPSLSTPSHVSSLFISQTSSSFTVTMAELRTAEEAVASLRLAYTDLRCRSVPDIWPELAVVTGQALPADNTNQKDQNATAVLQALDSIRDQLRSTDLQDKMDKFQKRLNEKDPITDKPRYGEKTQQRVQQLLQSYEELDGILRQIYGEPAISNDNDTGNSPTSTTAAAAASQLESLKQQAQREQEEQAHALRQAQEAQAQAKASAEREREAQVEAERQAAQAVQDERRRQRELVEEEARRAMQAQRSAEAAAARADQEWQASISKGANGVREQLQILLAATASDKATQRVAVDALHMIFSQIVARPEEVNYRRIRRNHPKFEADIGRHAGGKEILIAAGFRLGVIDEVPSYISTEPNVEKDMDGWGAWFDLHKETLAIIEETMIQL